MNCDEITSLEKMIRKMDIRSYGLTILPTENDSPYELTQAHYDVLLKEYARAIEHGKKHIYISWVCDNPILKLDDILRFSEKLRDLARKGGAQYSDSTVVSGEIAETNALMDALGHRIPNVSIQNVFGRICGLKPAICTYFDSQIEEVGTAGEGLAEAQSAVCSAGRENMFVIRANGRICKCAVAVDDEINDIGYIDLKNGKLAIDYNTEDLWAYTTFSSECVKCSNLVACCNRSCPLSRLRNRKGRCC